MVKLLFFIYINEISINLLNINLYSYCTGMAERPRPEKTWSRGRDLRRLGREAETLEDRDLRRLAGGAETLEDLPQGPRP